MYDAKVINLMIGAPSDIIDEIEIVKKTIYEWNNNHSFQRKYVLMPLHWTTNTYPSMGDGGQAIINKQMTNKSDILICLFGTRLGSPTDKFESGTIEEINEHINTGKPVMIYFKNFVEDLSKLDKTQFEKVNNFKEKIQQGALYSDYKSILEFTQQIKNHIEKVIYDITPSISNPTTNIIKKEVSNFDEKEAEIIQNWVESGRPEGFIIKYIGGQRYVLGNLQYQVEGGRDEVEWNDFIERLAKANFIQIANNSKGSTIFKLRKTAYDYVDSLEK